MRAHLLVLMSAVAFWGDSGLGETPPAKRTKPTHFCAEVCVGPCKDGGACACNGRTCLVEIKDPKKGLVLMYVENHSLPKRIRPCADRPLAKGKTFRLGQGVDLDLFWICNDPHCLRCARENEDFRADGEPPTSK